MTKAQRHSASFKDPAGFVFQKEGVLYRHIGNEYASHYAHLMASGLYQELIAQGQLIPHEEIKENLSGSSDFHVTLQPKPLDAISYPYEWSFHQLKDAALLTLSIMRKSLSQGMILKDATPYNIQFHQGRPIFIDTLSFEKHVESEPWVAYRQFCEMFLNPLLIQHYTGVDSIAWLRTYLTGIPASVTAALLPRKAYWSLSVWLHVLLPQKIKVNKQGKQTPTAFSLQKMQQLIQHLESTIQGLKPCYPAITTWNNYYTTTILGTAYLEAKEKLVLDFMQGQANKSILDLGANDGHFSLLLSDNASKVIAADIDAACIDRLYQTIQQRAICSVYPMVQQLANPSPNLGFNQKEREGFIERCQSDTVLALALIHHLTIGENIPLTQLADFFAALGPTLIIEFVAKEDEKVQQMLSTRKDVFDAYNIEEFEQSFQNNYTILRKENIPGTHRTLYLMQRK